LSFLFLLHYLFSGQAVLRKKEKEIQGLACKKRWRRRRKGKRDRHVVPGAARSRFLQHWRPGPVSNYLLSFYMIWAWSPNAGIICDTEKIMNRTGPTTQRQRNTIGPVHSISLCSQIMRFALLGDAGLDPHKFLNSLSFLWQWVQPKGVSKREASNFLIHSISILASGKGRHEVIQFNWTGQ
jgi:hypothetical protein